MFLSAFLSAFHPASGASFLSNSTVLFLHSTTNFSTVTQLHQSFTNNALINVKPLKGGGGGGRAQVGDSTLQVCLWQGLLIIR